MSSQAGLSAVAFDGPAHGKSDGWAASVPHFADAVAEVAGRTGAVAAVGHSMGGAAVALAAALAVLGIVINFARGVVNSVLTHWADYFADRGEASIVGFVNVLPTQVWLFLISFFPAFFPAFFSVFFSSSLFSS